MASFNQNNARGAQNLLDKTEDLCLEMKGGQDEQDVALLQRKNERVRICHKWLKVS